MKYWFGFISLLCIVLFFICSCKDNTANTPQSTAPDGGIEDTLSLETATSIGEQTVLPTETPSMTIEPTKDPLTMTLNGDGTSAVWWWDRFKASKTRRGEYLDFLEKNSINEIYICWPDFKSDDLASFVLDAGKRGIRVSLLSGDANWIYPDNNGIETVISEFLKYQKNANSQTRLASLHLDIEPHQLQAFNNDKEQILQYYADFVLKVSKAVRKDGEKLEWDIPFWFDEFEVTNEKGEKEELLELLARNSDTLCLMSYRDTAEAVLECSEKEISLGKRYGCKIVLGVETHSTEGDHVSFMEEGKKTMYRECEKVYGELLQKLGKENFGIAVHYLDTWYKLKD